MHNLPGIVAAEAVGASALSSVGASAPAGATAGAAVSVAVSVAGPGGADRRLVWPTRVGICAVWGVCLCDCVGRRPYVSLRYKSVSVLGVADSCFARGSGKSRRLNEVCSSPCDARVWFWANCLVLGCHLGGRFAKMHQVGALRHRWCGHLLGATFSWSRVQWWCFGVMPHVM